MGVVPTRCLLAGLLLWWPSMALAQQAAVIVKTDSIGNVEYEGGHAGMEHKVKGKLLISDDTISFLDKHDSTMFSIPVAELTDASSAQDRKDASTGSKIAFGFLARSRKEEYVTLAYESDTAAEAVVFRAPKNMSAGIVAKIHFRMKRQGMAADSSTAPNGNVPNGSGVISPQ